MITSPYIYFRNLSADACQASSKRARGGILLPILPHRRALQRGARALPGHAPHHGERGRRAPQQDRHQPPIHLKPR